MTPTQALELNPTHLGVTLFLLVLFWKLLEIAKVLFLNKQIPQQRESAVACRYGDPTQVEQMSELHEQLLKGNLKCHWKDREEVRDFIEAMRAQTTASKMLTAAFTALTEELRRTRNGNGK